jgi:hypothetical protein
VAKSPQWPKRKKKKKIVRVFGYWGWPNTLVAHRGGSVAPMAKEKKEEEKQK